MVPVVVEPTCTSPCQLPFPGCCKKYQWARSRPLKVRRTRPKESPVWIDWEQEVNGDKSWSLRCHLHEILMFEGSMGGLAAVATSGDGLLTEGAGGEAAVAHWLLAWTMLMVLMPSSGVIEMLFSPTFSQKRPSRHTFIEPRSAISYTSFTGVLFTVWIIDTLVELLGIGVPTSELAEKAPIGVVIEKPTDTEKWPLLSKENVTGINGGRKWTASVGWPREVLHPARRSEDITKNALMLSRIAEFLLMAMKNRRLVRISPTWLPCTGGSNPDPELTLPGARTTQGSSGPGPRPARPRSQQWRRPLT